MHRFVAVATAALAILACAVTLNGPAALEASASTRGDDAAAAAGSTASSQPSANDAETARLAAERARRRAQAAQRRAEAAAAVARREAARNSRERAAAQRAATAAREEAQREAALARQAEQRAANLDRTAQAAKQDAERAQEEARRSRTRLWVGLGIGGAVLVLAALGFAIARKKAKARAARAIDEMRRSRPDPVPSGLLRSARLNLQLPGDKLPEPAGGVVVGRNPELATAVISRNDVSRRHARFFHRDGQYWVEDLGSIGGTWVDGTRLQEEQPVAVVPGTAVRFASCEFVFQIAR